MDRALTEQNVLNYPIDTINTWPFILRGYLSEEHGSRKYGSKKLLQWYDTYLDGINSTVKEFVNRQITLMGFVIAAAVGVVGNLVINIFFGSVSIPEWHFVVIPILTLGVLIWLFTRYLTPALSFNIFWRPCNNEWIPKRDKLPRIENWSQADIEQQLYDLVFIVALALIRDFIRNAKLRNLKVANVNPFAQQNFPMFHLTITLSNEYKMIFPRIKKAIEFEFRTLIDQLFHSIMSFDARVFDYRQTLWSDYGMQFLNNLSGLDINIIKQELIKQIKTAHLLRQQP